MAYNILLNILAVNVFPITSLKPKNPKPIAISIETIAKLVVKIF